MFETLKVILVETQRNLRGKFKTSPILYVFFSLMVFCSIIMFAFLTFLLIKTEVDTTIMDGFFAVFFIMMLKASADFHTHFLKSPQIAYPLSTQINQKTTIGEIFLAILLMQLGLWFVFSGLYLLTLVGLRIDIYYPLEYGLFTLGIIIATLLGCMLAQHYFSPNRYRLLPALLFLGYFWLGQDLVLITLTFPMILLYFFWGIDYSMVSYRYVNRKERVKEKTTVSRQKVLLALFHRELTVLWRDRLLFSFVFTAISTAIGTGYLVLFGTDILVPESIRAMVEEFLPSMFVFLGVYVVVIYTAVFPGLNLFLNEEKTMWILRNLPVRNETVVQGKVLVLVPCFLTAVPFLAYISIFIGVGDLVFLSWFLVFSFIAGVIVSVPLGAKYVGKKSDVLLLYSIAMLLFVVMGIVSTVVMQINYYVEDIVVLYLLLLCFELCLLWFSLKLSARVLVVKSG